MRCSSDEYRVHGLESVVAVVGERDHPRRLLTQPTLQMETRNPRMAHLLSQLERIASSKATVLLQGESGTGKEVLARSIHSWSSRNRGPFVSLNCASMPEGVLESELFGHEKGAFTGAVRQRLGRFELAQGGSLLLDEIGAADMKVQLRLLRVLQEREFERLGGTQTIQADVRVIAATNVDLATAVKEGTFREDLFYRLNVLPVEVPPLRQRSEDIPLLVNHFISKIEGGRRIEGIDEEGMRALKSYPWPGNIRQLENTIERMVVLAQGSGLSLDDVPADILNWRQDEDLEDLGGGSYWEARALFERRFLREALQRYNGIISHAADAIGMSRKNHYSRLEHLNIDHHTYRAR